MNYPQQIFCEWGNNMQVNATFDLQAARESENEPPMEMHAGSLSRFPFTLVDKTGGTTKVLTANIPYKEVSAIRQKTLRAGIVMDHYNFFHGTGAQPQEGAVSAAPAKELPPGDTPAYKDVLPFGDLKGMTPVQALSLPDGRRKLEGMKAVLQKNADKYKVNRDHIAAIDEALSLATAEGTGGAQAPVIAPVVVPVYTIYERNYKYKKPLKDGKYTIYSIKFQCDFRKKYPWGITLSNVLAPLKKAANGQPVPDMSGINRGDVLQSTINLSDDIWIECADVMYRRLCQFENHQFASQKKRMDELVRAAKSGYAAQGPVTVMPTTGGVAVSVG